jgi:hypothetical protein
MTMAPIKSKDQFLSALPRAYLPMNTTNTSAIVEPTVNETAAKAAWRREQVYAPDSWFINWMRYTAGGSRRLVLFEHAVVVVGCGSRLPTFPAALEGALDPLTEALVHALKLFTWPITDELVAGFWFGDFNASGVRSPRHGHLGSRWCPGRWGCTAIGLRSSQSDRRCRRALPVILQRAGQIPVYGFAVGRECRHWRAPPLGLRDP